MQQQKWKCFGTVKWLPLTELTLPMPTSPCRASPAHTTDTVWFPCLRCAGRLPGTGLCTWDAANLCQCPSARSSTPDGGGRVLHTWTFLLHGAHGTLLTSSCNSAWHLPSLLQPTCKLAKVLSHHWNSAQGPTHYRSTHMTSFFLVANLTAYV